MKKLLLLSALAAMGATTVNAELPMPKYFEELYIMGLSPNGQWAASEDNGVVTVINLATGEKTEFLDEMLWYSIGLGNMVSNNGIVVGSTDGNSAEYFKDGDWHLLPVPAGTKGSSNANGITPDGSRICGSIGFDTMSADMEDVLMQTPVIWNANADGTYADPMVLPHPEFDFTGRVPQYIQCKEISADGKTIIGQITDAVGGVSYPIVYRQDASGEWSYEIVHPEFLVPEGLVFPPMFDEAPKTPSYEDYYTDEMQAEYDEIYNEWCENGYDYNTWPDPKDLLTQDQLDDLDARMEEYNIEYEAWSLTYNAWFDAYYECLDGIPGYEMNATHLSPDGKSFAIWVNVGDPFDFWSTPEVYSWIFDLTSDNITKLEENPNMYVYQMLDNNTMMVGPSPYSPGVSYIYKDGVMTALTDYISAIVPEYGEWMTETLGRDYEENNWMTGETTVHEGEILNGYILATPDLSVFTGAVMNVWDFETNVDSYVIDLNAAAAGINNVAFDKKAESAGETVIYDLLGRRVEKATAPGIYVVNGEKTVVR